jgi:hypothetical protein
MQHGKRKGITEKKAQELIILIKEEAEYFNLDITDYF